MAFLHDHPDFDDLLQIVARDRHLSAGVVEKDYWVTHVLWSLHRQGFEVWFKGGTSLSKGFGIIRRFSEDLDLKLEPGSVAGLPAVSDWTREGVRVTEERRAYFEALLGLLAVPGAAVSLLEETVARSWRNAGLSVSYPGRHLGDLTGMRDHVLLEVGGARVTPSVPRDMSSFVHDYVEAIGRLGEFEDNRPLAVRCVHPLVTLIEKLDALHRHVGGGRREPETFVRHYEDAARIIAALPGLEPIAGYPDACSLATEMLAQHDLRTLPSSDDVAFHPDDGDRWLRIRQAHEAIAHLFWGDRLSLDEACAVIRGWLEHDLDIGHP